ncbi:TMEM175 family protein [Streptomyces sp. NPDC050264]|uniref:TMEM175 family protein n=1 Tax=Streptomyces sp. NPDC050264 TaxID=3155038 RepID=UPI0034228927
MSVSGAVKGTGAGGPDPAEPSVPASDGIEGGASAERLVLFTDAVAAISITLLILPLVDLVPEVVSAHEAASKVITEHLAQIWSFLLSFAVVANIWLEHHRAFSAMKVTRPLMVWNMGWLLTVVVLPLPTEMIGSFGARDRFTMVFYYAVLLANLVSRLGMMKILNATPTLIEGDGPGARRRIGGMYTESYLNVLALVIAFALALAVPVLQYYTLVLLVVPPRLMRLRGRSAGQKG